MIDIATRAEQAAPEETRGLLIELRNAIDPWGFVHDCARRSMNACPRCNIFDALLAIGTDEAFLAAAMMLTDRGVDIRRTMSGRGIVTFYPKGFTAIGKSATSHAATPALAMIAAIARSLGK